MCSFPHICLCPCECSHLEPLCIHTYVTNVHIFHHRYLCISTRAVQSYTYTCHCECSQLEPLCIHAYTLKYTYIISKIILYVNPCCANSICLYPCECSHLEPLCIHAYTHKHTYVISQIPLYMNPCCANSHMSVPLRVLALRTSLHTYICSQVYCTYSITDIFVYKLMLCKLTYVCALANAHTQNLFLYLYSQVYIYQESYHGYVGISTRSVHSHTCLCPCQCSHLEPLCIHAYNHKYTYIISQIFVYINPCCANSHMSVPLRVPTL